MFFEVQTNIFSENKKSRERGKDYLTRTKFSLHATLDYQRNCFSVFNKLNRKRPIRSQDPIHSLNILVSSRCHFCHKPDEKVLTQLYIYSRLFKHSD